mmetsp:Transcript_30795/g.63767  ORF Transcript_30795/g.63767 Transcript_30795/m.63767 type:complete len:332 (+) Transcript_30795:555-1550(+)
MRRHTRALASTTTIFSGLSNLVMVVDGIDFMWASASKRKQGPEELLEEFLRYTQVKISKIRLDDAGEFATSESFRLWCANRDIVICATAGYNHTMQARAEGAVRITKEHIRCLLKTANMPYSFWPWALTQFCRLYNYWPKKGHAPPWVMLAGHRFSQSLHRDLHPFGCYIIGKLPREHPLVPNTTLSDRGLEGAFLGWDLSTPTVWMWSFRLKKPVRLHDPVFYDDRFPFADPSCLRVSLPPGLRQPRNRSSRSPPNLGNHHHSRNAPPTRQHHCRNLRGRTFRGRIRAQLRGSDHASANPGTRCNRCTIAHRPQMTSAHGFEELMSPTQR